MIKLFGTLPYRFLMNVGDHIDRYADTPGNVHLDKWYPQPPCCPMWISFIHHGGNNSFNEALYFGKPAIIMPYCWDGLGQRHAHRRHRLRRQAAALHLDRRPVLVDDRASHHRRGDEGAPRRREPEHAGGQGTEEGGRDHRGYRRRAGR
jgi:hypothetical protein